MLIVLSPAKKLHSITSRYSGTTTAPIFVKKTNELISLMKKKSMTEIATLMSLSDDLAELNYQRYQSFELDNNQTSSSYPAIFMFQGDVYRHLKAELWDKATLDYAQSHLAILSGLYGILRPLDYIQPYRLEMGTRLNNSCGKNLYEFWKFSLADELNKRLIRESNKWLINLASSEYFKAIDEASLVKPVITVHFMERKKDKLKIIGIQAKKARGTMANYIIQNRIETPDEIKRFNLLDYHFCEKTSTDRDFYFIR